MAKSKAKKKTAKKQSFSINDDRIPKVLGVISIMLAIYLAVAFVSYLYTWKVDQDKVLAFSWEVLFQKDLTVENWLGRLGALVSNAFFYWGFGLPSAVVVVLLLKLGVDLTRRKSLAGFINLAKNSLVFMAFASLCLEFIFRNSDFTWGGAFGQSTYIWLSNFIGQIGLFLLLLFALGAYLMWKFNPNLDNVELSSPFGNIELPNFGSYFDNFKLDSDLNTKDKPIDRPSTAKVTENDGKSMHIPLRPSGGSSNQAMPKTGFKERSEGASDSNLEFELPDSPTKRKKPMTSAKGVSRDYRARANDSR